MRPFLGIGVGFGVLGMVLGAATEARAQGGWTDDGVNVRLTSPGDRVGIGTAAPIAKLQVIGNTRIEGKLFLTDALFVPSNGIFHLTVGGRSPNLIGGSQTNQVDPAVVGATIAGGGDANLDPNLNPRPNIVTDSFGTIGGGRGDQAGDGIGIVPTKVSAENGAIKPGDLLTTATVPGHAMKASPVMVSGVALYPTGAILGKSLGSLGSGTGFIRVLVMLK